MNRLKEFRSEKGLTVRDLSDMTGIAFSTISALENGRRKMNANHANLIADILGVDPQVLIADDNFAINPDPRKRVVVRKESIRKENRLREIREKRGYTMTKLAKLIDANRPDISYWESGIRVIPEHHFDILCEVLKVSEEMLLGIDKSPIPDAEITEDDVLTPDDYIKPTNRERKQTLTNKKGYVFVYDPLNPMATQSGYVALHRLVMSVSIGRPLTAEEVVHHIDENPSNNRLSNLMLFRNNADHIKHHKEMRDKAAQQSALELAQSLIDL